MASSSCDKLEIVVVAKTQSSLGEGPHWIAGNDNALFWVDIIGKKLYHLEPSFDGEFPQTPKEYNMENAVGCLAPYKLSLDELKENRKTENLILGTKVGIQAFHLPTSTLTTLVSRDEFEPNKEDNRFNDGKVGPCGRFFAGTMSQNDAQASLYIFDGDKLKRVRDKVGISNGLTWSPYSHAFYYIDSPSLQVVGWDYSRVMGTLSNERVVLDFAKDFDFLKEGEVPDGMTIDCEGKLWIAFWDGGCVRRFDPVTSKLLRTINMPCPKPTSVCFGGPDLTVLFVTSSSVETDTEKYPEAGNLFMIRNIGVGGIPMSSFDGVPPKN